MVILRSFEEILRDHPEINRRPLVTLPEINEISPVLDKLPPLKFPINSASELIEQLGGPEKSFEIEGIILSPIRMIKYMPAYYFPISSPENFIEKMVELIRANRRPIDFPKEIENLKRQLPTFDYPIENKDHLLKMLGARAMLNFRGEEVEVDKVIRYISPEDFPIGSEKELYNKARSLMMTRRLIERD